MQFLVFLSSGEGKVGFNRKLFRWCHLLILLDCVKSFTSFHYDRAYSVGRKFPENVVWHFVCPPDASNGTETFIEGLRLFCVTPCFKNVNLTQRSVDWTLLWTDITPSYRKYITVWTVLYVPLPFSVQGLDVLSRDGLDFYFQGCLCFWADVHSVYSLVALTLSILNTIVFRWLQSFPHCYRVPSKVHL